MNRDIVEKAAKTLLNDLAGTFPVIDLDVLTAEELGELAAYMRTASWHLIAAADLAALRGRPAVGE